MKKIVSISLIALALVSLAAAPASAEEKGQKDPIAELVASKEAATAKKEKPVSWCVHQEKKYDCGAKKIVVFRANGEISCRGPQNLAEKGERFCTAQSM